MVLIAILVFLTVAFVMKYCLHMRKMESYVKNIPSASSGSFLPFLGNALEMFVVKSTADLHKKTIAFFDRVDTPSKLYLGPYLQINLDKPEDVKTVLTSPACHNKPYFYQLLPNTKGLFTIKC